MADFDNLFDDDYGYEPEVYNQEEEQQELYEETPDVQYNDEDLIGDLLSRQGISNPEKIKFEGEDGIIKERNWDELDYNEKLNILSNNSYNPETDLDDDEIDMINAIRSSKLSPAEYMNTVRNQAVNDYYSQNQGNMVQPNYTVDDYTDDELFLYDMQSRMPDMTDEELTEALENAKANETVFEKQVNGIRNEYRQLENNKIQQEQAIALQYQQLQYQQYANSVINAIDSLNDIADIFEIEDEDKQAIAYGILGQDQAGISNLGKALNDPHTLAEMMWFALMGKDAIAGMDQYYKDQISKARLSGYQKGLEDARNGNSGSRVVKKQKLQNKQYKTVDDLY